MQTIDTFARQLADYLEPNQVDQVVRAYNFAEIAHTGQVRKSGEAYINHPLAVATILSEMRMDHQCLMAALLHDVIEDTGVAKDQLGSE
ncbi:MAG: HD domain-containing protein, partial [Gammaproteobacteria bacterium]|nr:HD domain-containing protein [Gammaproteobacteria bacterium]